MPGLYRQRATWMEEATVANQISQRSTLYHAGTVMLDEFSAEIVNGPAAHRDCLLPGLEFYDRREHATRHRCMGPFRHRTPRRHDRRSGAQLFDTSNSRPDGSRALFAYSRIRSDCVTPDAFPYQANTRPA